VRGLAALGQPEHRVVQVAFGSIPRSLQVAIRLQKTAAVRLVQVGDPLGEPGERVAVARFVGVRRRGHTGQGTRGPEAKGAEDGC
jgi:hypothetical protein